MLNRVVNQGDRIRAIYGDKGWDVDIQPSA